MKICSIHNQPYKLIPAGISKAGKPYAAFEACPVRGCKGPAVEEYGPGPSFEGEKPANPHAEAITYDEAKGRRMNRSNLAAAALRSGRPIDETMMQDLRMLVAFVDEEK